MDDRRKELEQELVSSLKTFGRLYDQKVEPLHPVSDVLELTEASVCSSFRCRVIAVACLLGGLSGGIFSTICEFAWGFSRAEDEILGSIFGGVAGGALGTAMCALPILLRLVRSPVRDVNSSTAWLIACAAGGAAGAVIGGILGAKGGALGGVFGALWAVHVSDDMKHLGDVRDSGQPLLEQLKSIQIICDKLAPHHHVPPQHIQAAASLDALAKREEVIVVALSTTYLSELVSGVLAAAALSRNVTKELEELRRSLETFLRQLSGTSEDHLSD